MQTTRPISASMASSIPLAANGGLVGGQHSIMNKRRYYSIIAYGTKIAEAVAPVSFTASLTLANTGFPRCVSPAFLGLVPPTTLVPICLSPVTFLYHSSLIYRNQWLAERESCSTLSN